MACAGALSLDPGPAAPPSFPRLLVCGVGFQLESRIYLAANLDARLQTVQFKRAHIPVFEDFEMLRETHLLEFFSFLGNPAQFRANLIQYL